MEKLFETLILQQNPEDLEGTFSKERTFLVETKQVLKF